MQLSQACEGRWGELLPIFGIDRSFLKNRHGSCPVCGGKDRFRYDNRNNRGDFFCNQCGAGDGFKLIQLKTGKSFRDIAREIEDVVGRVPRQAHRAEATLTDGQIRDLKNRLWRACKPVQPNGLVMRYLSNRGLSGFVPGEDVREIDGYCWVDPVTGSRLSLTGMVALVRRLDGAADTLHQTPIAKGVRGKRFVTRGGISPGASVRLFSECETVLGIAEGIETAIAASMIFNEPVDAAINQKRMLDWRPRDGVKRVLVMADNDVHFSGQSHSYQLANRLSNAGYAVDVMVPRFPGWDWNDELMDRLEKEAV